MLLGNAKTLANLHFEGDKPYLINPPTSGYSNTKHYLTADEIEELSFDKDIIRSALPPF